MRAVTAIRSLWWNLLRRDRVDAALDDELRAYVDMLAAEYERAGMEPAAARRRALIETGGVDQVKEATRDVWLGDAIARLARDVRYALRGLRRSPAFCAVAVATLAIGIGGATAVFTVVSGTILRPLPAVREPERLVSLERVQPTVVLDEFGWPEYRDLRAQTTALSGVAAFNGTSLSMRLRGDTTRAWVSYVSGDFFSVLGVEPMLGRAFETLGDDRLGAPPVAVIGYELWRDRLGASPSAIGTTLALEGVSFTIIGVAPPGFVGAMTLHPMQLWIPATAMPLVARQMIGDDFFTRRGVGWARLIGRLAPGRSAADANRELATISARLAAAYPTDRGKVMRIAGGPGMTSDERDDIARVPRLLSIAIVVLLLIASANVATLSLVRAAARRRELATRLALGASRGSLVRQLTIEAALLAGAGAAGGVLLASALVRSAPIVDSIPSVSPADLHLSIAILALTVGVTAVTAMLVAALPAWRVAALSPAAVLKHGTAGAVQRRSGGQRALVVAQVAASLTLLAAAAIIASGLRRVLTRSPGFDIDGVSEALLQVAIRGYTPERQLAYLSAVLQRASDDPDVERAGLTSTLPPQPFATRLSVFRAGEEPSPAELAGHDFELGLRAYVDEVSPSLFATMGIAIVRGRGFTSADDASSTPVVIVNRRLAETLWPGEDPIGRYLAWPTPKGDRRPRLLVVGVAADTRHAALASDPTPGMYVPFAQRPAGNLFLVLRGRGGRDVGAAVFRRVGRAIDASVPVLVGPTLREGADEEMQPQRTAAAWVGVFGAIALLLAAIGVYGVVAQGVLQRTRELAVRAAIGATPRKLLALVVVEGMRLSTAGLLLGVASVLAIVPVIAGLFVGVRFADAWGAIPAVAVLGVAMLAACWIPARRAARLDPARVLRAD